MAWNALCSCPPTTIIEEEIRLLDDHREFFREQIGTIDKKIVALRSAKES